MVQATGGLDDLIGVGVAVDEDILNAPLAQKAEDSFEHGDAPQRHEGLGEIAGEGAQAGAIPRREDHGSGGRAHG